MNTIEELNEKYKEMQMGERILCKYSKRIVAEQQDLNLRQPEKFLHSLKHLTELTKEFNCTGFAFLMDTLALGTCCKNYIDAVMSYRDTLLEVIENNVMSDVKIINATNAVKDTKKKYERTKGEFLDKYKIVVDSIETLGKVFCQCLEYEHTYIKKAMEKIRFEVKPLLEMEFSIELKADNHYHTEEKLPEAILVARYPVEKMSYDLVNDERATKVYHNIFNDLKNQGNIVINVDFMQMADVGVDVFVIAYILRFIEEFPLGAVNVHIFDKNANYIYKRLCNSFQIENAGDRVKKVVQLHSSISEIEKFQNVVCEDIFKKTSVDTPDLYSVYESDRTDAFNLIVLRNGLVESSGHVSEDILEIINTLTKPNNIGHKCGLRFLIIDASESFIKNLNLNTKFIINSIRQNCNLQLDYQNGEYLFDTKRVEVLTITDELDAFVQAKSYNLANAIANKEKTCVSLDEVCSNKVYEFNDSIMYIPVGKSGSDVVGLPLSCKDENGTIAGQCIGYMAIGQSGSGKSSFFHSVVLNGCLKYSPKNLQFWLLDFKFGGASSKYSNSGLPHVRIIAENNKIDDALCLFQMVFEEMDRRNRAFNQNFVDNIVDYNRIANATEGLEYFPRIIVAIDEVQEIFREDNATVLQKLISSISVRMRSAGIHFIMVAQNLCEGKSYMLKDAFLPSATGRICFRVAPNIPRDSGFEEEFSQRKQEISELKTGEAYIGYGKDTIKKIKMAYASPEDMSNKYFEMIRSRHPEYSNMKPLVIGSKKRLALDSFQQFAIENYYDAINSLKSVNGIYSVIVGEDAYRMRPLSIRFSQHENSAVLLLGSNKEISSSLCTSITTSLMKQNVHIHIFNGDKTKVLEENESIAHPFLYICQKIDESYKMVQNYRLNQLGDVLKNLYSKYLERQEVVQKADEEVPDSPAEFLIVNDLFAIDSFVSNDIIESSESDVSEPTSTNKYTGGIVSRIGNPPIQKKGQFKENIQNIMSILVKNGYRYNIHIVLAIKGDPLTWRNSRIVSEVNSIILFNETQYVEQVENSFYLKEMLRNISNNAGEETMAVWASKKSFSKIRPIIFKMSYQKEKDFLDKLVVEGITDEEII